MNAYSYNFGGKPSKPVLRYNNFGGSIGGPIIKRKLFFYFNFDKIIQHGGSQPVFYTVPTTAVLGGDFTGFPTIYDPQTTTVVGGVVHRTSFADEYHNGNKIPGSRIDPVASAISIPQAELPCQASYGTRFRSLILSASKSLPF